MAAGTAPLWLWIVFHLLVFALFAADFFLTRGSLSPREVRRNSSWLTALWIAAALLFTLVVDRALAPRFALEYLTGYGIEQSLSIDNLFVFLLLFRAFGLQPSRQRRVLFYGVLGAMLLRAAMIAAGIRLLQTVAWINYLFGAILLYTAWRLLCQPDNPDRRGAPRWAAWLAAHSPLATGDHGERFLVRERGRWRFTPLLVALLAIEITDLMFATDSVPAVLAISRHPFVVYSSNIFAVLGLRSFYFTLAATLERLHKLHYGLAAILAFVGAKMMLARWLAVPTWISLLVLSAALTLTAIWSLWSPPPAPQNQ